MRVLITNRVLLRGSGTETVVRDLALELRKLGHEPIIYSPITGAVADQVRAQGLPVFTDIREVKPIPDILHGQHHAETLTALLRFPDTPAIFVCHDATAWHDDPLLFPRVLRYIAVGWALMVTPGDEETRRLVRFPSPLSVIDLVIVTPPKPPGSSAEISPPGSSF